MRGNKNAHSPKQLFLRGLHILPLHIATQWEARRLGGNAGPGVDDEISKTTLFKAIISDLSKTCVQICRENSTLQIKLSVTFL